MVLRAEPHLVKYREEPRLAGLRAEALVGLRAEALAELPLSLPFGLCRRGRSGPPLG